jgi:hexosaminidase
VLASTNKQPAEQAVDGSMETRWESEFSDPQWLQLGMVQEMAFTRVELYWQDAYGKEYDIDISDDGETWTTVYSETNGVGGLDVIDLPGNTGRYIRMFGKKRGTQWGYSLFEFNVSGNPLLEPFPPPELPLVSCSAIVGQKGKCHV